MEDRADPGKMNFVLSICIPTFNRADMLRATLKSMIASEAFAAGKVHIFISDNASTDHTPHVCAEFATRYPEQIQFRRLPESIPGDLNFERAMRGGIGTFQKLHTDKGPFASGALDRLVRYLENCPEKISAVIPMPALPDGSNGEIPIRSAEDVIKNCSYWITDINLCCVRHAVLAQLPEPFRYWERHFSQIDILFRLLNEGSQAVLIGGVFIPSFRPLYPSNRNTACTFGYHYVSILHEQVSAKTLRRKTYQQEKRKLLFRYIIIYHFDFFHQYMEPVKPLPFLRWMKYYYFDWFFYAALVWIAFYWTTSRIIPLHQACGWCKRQIQRRIQNLKNRGRR